MTFSSTLPLPLTTLAEVFSRVFEGYTIPISPDPSILAARIRQEQIDLVASKVVRAPSSEVVGIALVALRGNACRLAGMGIMASWRGRGVGQELMNHVLDEARARGDRRMVLEVIERNTRAVLLYERCGFVPSRRLIGYEATHIDHTSSPLEEVDIAEFAAAVARHGNAGLPWQLAPATLGAVTRPSMAFRLDKAHALVTPTAEVVTLRGVVVESRYRRRGNARSLVRGIANQFVGRRWLVPALVPETLADGFLPSLGFERGNISQLEMVRDLTA